eukprot:TRINITY_DN1156_c0_g2_i2.p1 TRINITY_DN1156_c0_g2~~TRINITY_DN1156_c0_g2_i2.p1  ORF type:complete len:775 (+),score=212.03 TRINITY_DN1156_c0_g2_i2:34-2358(+)
MDAPVEAVMISSSMVPNNNEIVKVESTTIPGLQSPSLDSGETFELDPVLIRSLDKNLTLNPLPPPMDPPPQAIPHTQHQAPPPQIHAKPVAGSKRSRPNPSPDGKRVVRPRFTPLAPITNVTNYQRGGTGMGTGVKGRVGTVAKPPVSSNPPRVAYRPGGLSVRQPTTASTSSLVERSTTFRKPAPKKPLVTQSTTLTTRMTYRTNTPSTKPNQEKPVDDIVGFLQEARGLVHQMKIVPLTPAPPPVDTTGPLIALEISKAKEYLKKLEDEDREAEQRFKITQDTLQLRLLQITKEIECLDISINEVSNERSSCGMMSLQLQEEAMIIRDQTRDEVEMCRAEGEVKKNLFIHETSLKEAEWKKEFGVADDEENFLNGILNQRNKTHQDLEAEIDRHRNLLLFKENKARKDELSRRQLHEAIQELKGNIRVICRIRPLMGTESSQTVQYNYLSSQELSIEIEGKERAGRKIEKQQFPFKFDRIFPPDTNQRTVFEEISHLVQSALDGYNCCIFAYGQTGSGKTYTMEGSEDVEDEETRGMISRAVTQIFDSSSRLTSQGWRYKMVASFMEVYNDVIRDLLAKDFKSKVLEAKNDPKTNKIYVPDLTQVNVSTPSQVFELLRRASHNRTTAETLMNHSSSRSHSIFQLSIQGHNTVTAENIDGTLNLIDLAGSEKLEQSGAAGTTKTETIAINSSLTNLGNVITAVASGAKHVPYRSCTLTYLLQNSIGGSAKTMMFVNISPADRNVKETISSLRFATKVNSCEIGTAKKKTNFKF